MNIYEQAQQTRAATGLIDMGAAMIYTSPRADFDPEWLGLVPSFLSAHDARPASEQIDENYAHGGGWSPIKGFSITFADGAPVLHYADEPDTPSRKSVLLAMTEVHDDLLLFFDGEMLAIVKEDGTFEVNRMD